MFGFLLGIVGCVILLLSFGDPVMGQIVSIGIGIACVSLSFAFREKYEKHRYSFHPFNKANKHSARFWFGLGVPLVLIPILWIAYGP